jgi:hypothetical protein
MESEWIAVLMVPIAVVLFFAWLEVQDQKTKARKRAKEIKEARLRIKRVHFNVRR